MLEIPWHVQLWHLAPDGKKRRLLIPALAMALDERGVVLGTPTYTLQWEAAYALPRTPQWLFGAFRQPTPPSQLKAAYERGDIWASDAVTVDPRNRKMLLQRQRQGRWPLYIHRISQWIDARTDEEGMIRLSKTIRPPPRHEARRLGVLADTPFTPSELSRVYGQSCPNIDPEARWVVYTDESVIQRDGRARGAFAGTFTQGPDSPINFRGRVLELPLSSTRMEAMAIITAIIIAPPTAALEIHTDSEAAIHMMHHVMAPVASRELYNSSDAFPWLHLRDWM
jgi:hypothetical protein